MNILSGESLSLTEYLRQRESEAGLVSKPQLVLIYISLLNLMNSHNHFNSVQTEKEKERKRKHYKVVYLLGS